jgi:hypothetical protein
MNYSKTIRIFDPFYGWGMHSDYYRDLKENSPTMNDTGLCNRLFHWELFSEICDKSGDEELTLAVQNMIWPEMAILHLPNTIGVDYKIFHNDWYGLPSHFEMFFKTIFDVGSNEVYLTQTLSEEKIMSMYNSNKFNFIDEFPHWHTEYGYYTINYVYHKMYGFDYENHLPGYRPIRNIKLKNEKLHRTLENRFSNVIGIHIRRGNGVTITDDDIKTFKPSLQKKFIEYKEKYFRDVSDIYKFQEDSIYFAFIDFILDINPKQKFYISHDLPDEFIDVYYERYGNLIITKKDYREDYTKIFKKDVENLNHLIKYANIVDNVTDLLSLSLCKFLVEAPLSSWSSFAKVYGNKESIKSNLLLKKLKDKKFYNEMEEIVNRPIPNIL